MSDATGSQRLLDGVRVLDLSTALSGPYGSMLLADMGADVVKVEPPSGDPMRTMHPLVGGWGLVFTSINRNKRGAMIDLKTDAGRELALKLAAKADVVYNNFRPGVMERLGLDYDTISARNDKVVYCSLSGFGANGPRALSPSYDVAIQAFAGGMSLTGYPDSAPARAGIPISDLYGGACSVIAILAALTRRGITGKGCCVETSLFDGHISLLSYWASLALNTDTIPGRQGGGNIQVAPYGPVEASDGWLVIAPYGEHFWDRVCASIERNDLTTDPRFLTNVERVKNRKELDEEMAPAFAKRSVAEWLTRLEEFDVPAGPINDVRQAMLDPQVAARDLMLEIDIDGHHLNYPGNPIKQVPRVSTPVNPPPRVGQHTAEVLSEWLGLDGDATTS